jgi:hypothetical protein
MEKNPQKQKNVLKNNKINKETMMNLDLHEILPEEISDAEAARLADILMGLALAVESHYYSQIIRHIRTLSAVSEEPF